MIKWYYLKGRHSHGPVSQEALISMVREGVLNEKTLIRAKELDQWKPVKEIFDFTQDVSTPSLPLNRPFVGPSPLEAEGWAISPPHPWRRFFARMIDYYINGTIVITFITIIFTIIDAQFMDTIWKIFDDPEMLLPYAIINEFFSTFLTAAFISFTGTSIGKYLFGIKITDKTSYLINYKLAWRRELSIWMRGRGFGLPMITLFTLCSAYKRLLKTGTTSWDNKFNLLVHYKPNHKKQIIRNIIGIGIYVCIGIIAWTSFLNERLTYYKTHQEAIAPDAYER